jgi:hypothetical protein
MITLGLTTLSRDPEEIPAHLLRSGKSILPGVSLRAVLPRALP